MGTHPSRRKRIGVWEMGSRFFRLLLLRLLRLPESTKSIARGVAIGLFIAFTPTIGIQMGLAFVVCLPFRASKIAAITMCWLTNALTAIPVYSFNFVVGQFFYPVKVQFRSEYLSSFDQLLKAGTDFLIVLWLGSGIVSIILGVLGYVLTMKYYTQVKETFLSATKLKLRNRLEADKKINMTNQMPAAEREEIK